MKRGQTVRFASKDTRGVGKVVNVENGTVEVQPIRLEVLRVTLWGAAVWSTQVPTQNLTFWLRQVDEVETV